LNLRCTKALGPMSSGLGAAALRRCEIIAASESIGIILVSHLRCSIPPACPTHGLTRMSNGWFSFTRPEGQVFKRYGRKAGRGVGLEIERRRRH
jgi:hypothetical protein